MNFNKVGDVYKRSIIYLSAHKVIVGVVILVLIAIVFLGDFEEESEIVEDTSTKSVDIAYLGIPDELEPLEITGRIEAVADIELKAEVSGQIRILNKSEGELVNKGDFLMKLADEEQQASLLQAQAVLENARAQLRKVEIGTREEELAILEANLLTATRSFSEARANTINILNATYIAAFDAAKTKTDQVFNFPNPGRVSFTPAIASYQVVIDLEKDRLLVESVLEDQELRRTKLDSSMDTEMLIEEINVTETELRFIGDFLNNLASALNSAISSTKHSESSIANYVNSVAAAQSEISSALLNLSSGRNTLSSQSGAFDVATQQLDKGVTGAIQEDIKAVEAQVKQAEGSLVAAQVAFSKTIIRSAISGAITDLPVGTGDFVGVGQIVARIKSLSNLEVVTYVSERDRLFINEGSKVEFIGSLGRVLAEGIVENVASNINSATQKAKISIKISQEEQSKLGVLYSEGQSIQLTLVRTIPENIAQIEALKGFSIVPLTAIQIIGSSEYVYSIDEDSRAKKHPVSVGALLGTEIVITSGLDQLNSIIVDVRGITENDIVNITK